MSCSTRLVIALAVFGVASLSPQWAGGQEVNELELIRQASTKGVVIKAGQDKILERMVTLGSDFPCSLQGASAGESVVEIEYSCAGRRARIDLRSPAWTGSSLAETKKFKLVAGPNNTPSEELVTTLTASISAAEEHFVWVKLRDSHEAEEFVFQPPPPPVSEDYLRRYAEAETLARSEEPRAALGIALELAREEPTYSKLLAKIAAMVEAAELETKLVDEYSAQADSSPQNKLAQFVAGVSNFHTATDIDSPGVAKNNNYRRALSYFEATRPDYDFEASIFGYLAMIHFVLGEGEQAEIDIEHCLDLDPGWADGYLYRAQIYQEQEIGRAILDLEAYLWLMRGQTRYGPAAQRFVQAQELRTTLGELQSREGSTPLGLGTMKLPRRLMLLGAGILLPISLLGGLALYRKRRVKAGLP